MRRYFALFIIICVSSTMIFFVFVSNLTLQPISQVQTTILSKQWTLSARNNARLVRLHKKYSLLLNLTAFKTNHLSDRTMIYSCQSFCGGWDDRLRGIISVYVLALLTHCRFMIDMNYSCNIFIVLEPNLINWTYIGNTKSKNRTRLNISTMRSWQTKIQTEIVNMIKLKDFGKAWLAYDDIFISTNSDYMTLALRNSYMSKETRQLLGSVPVYQAAMQILFPLLFKLLFKPSSTVRQRVESVLRTSYHRHLICLHIRIGKNPTNPFDHAFIAPGNTTKPMLNFTDNYLLNKSSALVFVTSDSGQAISDVLQHYPNSSMTVVGSILHIDRFDRRSSTICDGFLKVMADFYLLGECQTSLLSNSGFSSWANRRREKPYEKLYIYNEKSRTMRKG